MLPSLPLTPREYATAEVGDLLALDVSELKAQAWGVLHCEDADGKKWTALGDYAFAATMRRVAGREPGLSDDQAGEFPAEEFKTAWVVEGWPDQWAALAEDHPLSVVRY